MVAAFAAGTGPVAVDAERASGYRYGQRAYLVQLRREGAGSALIDPVGCPDLSALGEALTGAEWVLHAATQDLPCLRDIGMTPTSLFDTELAGRLAGFPRVGLGAMVENVLGYALEKGHSAVDWSTRPLPEPWLRYAALDVELLVDLRDALEEELDRQGKLEWALRGVRRHRLGPAGAPAQGPVAPHLRHAQGAPPPSDRGRTGAVDRPRPGSRSGATSRRARCSATPRSSRRPWRCPPNVQALTALPGLRPPDGAPAAGAVAGGRRPGQGAARVGAAAAGPAAGGPAAAPLLGGQGPGRRGPAVGGPDRGVGARRGAATCRRRT